MADDEITERRKEARNSFWKAAKEAGSRMFNEAPKLYEGADHRFYRSECQMIKNHLEPVYWGGFVAVFLFGTFRISGSQWYARFYQQHVAQYMTWSLYPPAVPTGTKPPAPAELVGEKFKQRPTQWKSYLDRQLDLKKAEAEEVFRLPLDVVISIMGGLSSILWLTQWSVLPKDFAEAPLVKGKSAIHSLVCPAMVEIHAAHKQVDPGDDETLRTFQTFAENCRIRSEYIRTKELEGGIDRPDVIPYPGLDGAQR